MKKTSNIKKIKPMMNVLRKLFGKFVKSKEQYPIKYYKEEHKYKSVKILK